MNYDDRPIGIRPPMEHSGTEASPPPKEIPTFLGQIAREHEIMCSLIDELEQAVRPVLSAGGVAERNEPIRTAAPMRESCTDVGNLLSNILARASEANSQIRKIIGRVQL